MAKEGTLSSFRESSRRFVKSSVLSVALLSAAFVAAPAFAGEALTPPTPSSTAGLPSSSNPATSSTSGQMMAMQQAVMANGASGNSSFDGNVPKSTSLSANFGYMDTFGNQLLGSGYGGGVTATHWITSNFGLQASIEIESFGFNTKLTGSTASYLNSASGTPIIPITLGAIYDMTGGKNWINPQLFADFGPAVSLYGQSVPVYFDAGAGVTAPLAKLSDTLAGIDLFANVRLAYLDQISGALSGPYGGGSNLGNWNGAAMFYMPIEFGATFVF